MSPEQVLEFWFDPANRKGWFRATVAFDRLVREQFEPAWQAARDGQLGDWEDSPRGALALVIVLDQLPLNMYRGQALGFATEAQAIGVADRALARQFDRQLAPAEQAFLYLPFMHSESLADQERAVALFELAGLADNLRWARHHREIVRRFGRFPHRNGMLGRTDTPEEREWLASPEAFRG